MEDVFDPLTDFQVLETFEYQEEVQRPEALRFFTLDDQLKDYFESRIPTGRMTKYQSKQLAAQLDRMREAYTRTIELTDTDYGVRPRAAPRMPVWVRPLFQEPDLKKYDYRNDWQPLFAKEQLMLANYYPRMLAAIPRPYATPASDHPAIRTTTVGHLDDDAKTELRGLGDYVRTKSVKHEDGSVTITAVPMSNTRDDLRTRGFLLRARGVDIPNPLQDHPFLEYTQVRTLITDQPFEDVYPSVDAILTHAVPTTTDPYGIGQKFLKVYDVKLSEISWDAWKSRFPGVDTIHEAPPPVSIKFPGSDATVPSENIRASYILPWMPGFEPRYWLQQQDDAGQLIIKMLLSRASSAGLLAVQPLGDVLDIQFPQSTPDDCLAVDSFDAFLNGGVYRKDRCVPVSAILQERKKLIATGRLPWKDGTETEILSAYQRTLQSFQLKEPGKASRTYESVPLRGIPQLRRDILVVLKDPKRLDEDKLDGIQTLVKDLIPVNQVYVSADGGFLICGHTLAVLKGDLEKDEHKFYRSWTGIDAGQRVCLRCGERIGQVFVQQDEFDDTGRLMVSHAALDRPSFQGETQVDTMTYSLRKLQSVFQMDIVSENVFYTMLSMLHILPTSEQLLAVLTVIRSISGSLRKASKNPEFTNRTDGILGLAGVIILIQGYMLIPNRFQSLKYSGFPRDTKETEKRGIVDSLMYILRSTFEAFPASFRGSVAPFFRAVLTKSKDVRKETLQNVQRIVERHFKSLMESAHEQYVQAGNPVGDEEVVEQPLYRPSERPQRPAAAFSACPSVRPMNTLEAKAPPVLVQAALQLKYGVLVGNTAKFLLPEPVTVVRPTSMADADIRRRIKLGFPASLKLPELKRFIEDTEDGLALASVLHRLLDDIALPTIRTELIQLKVTDLYRDSVRGLFYEAMHAVSTMDNVSGITQQIQGLLKHDIVVRMLVLSKKVAEKEQQELRASERENLKDRLRRMDDTRRELTKLYLDMGISGHIITPEDRELFFKARAPVDADPEKAYAEQAVEDDADRPEEGYVSVRDYVDNGDVPKTDAGADIDVDYGDYGDRAVRDYDDYANVGGNMDDDNDYGA